MSRNPLKTRKATQVEEEIEPSHGIGKNRRHFWKDGMVSLAEEEPGLGRRVWEIRL